MEEVKGGLGGVEAAGTQLQRRRDGSLSRCDLEPCEIVYSSHMIESNSIKKTTSQPDHSLVITYCDVDTTHHNETMINKVNCEGMDSIKGKVSQLNSNCKKVMQQYRMQ